MFLRIKPYRSIKSKKFSIMSLAKPICSLNKRPLITKNESLNNDSCSMDVIIYHTLLTNNKIHENDRRVQQMDASQVMCSTRSLYIRHYYQTQKSSFSMHYSNDPSILDRLDLECHLSIPPFEPLRLSAS